MKPLAQDMTWKNVISKQAMDNFLALTWISTVAKLMKNDIIHPQTGHLDLHSLQQSGSNHGKTKVMAFAQ